MSYSDFYLKSRNKPSGILYLVAMIAIGAFAATFFRPSTPSVRASKETIVYHTIANVSTHQAGVYYQTTNPTKSWVVYGESPNNLDRAAFDDRDTQANKSNYTLHFLLLTDLQENTKYSYKIIADGAVVSVNGEDIFTFTTPKTPALDTTSSTNPAYGKVLQQNNDPVNNGFVLYYYPGAYPLISPIRGGDWLIALNSLLDRKDNKQLLPKATDQVKIELITEELRSTTIETLLGNTTPLSKTVIIGTPYSNDKQEGVLAAHVEVKITPTPTVVVKQLVQTNGIGITFPKEKAVVPGNNPLIKGVGVPSTQVGVSLRSAKQTILSTKVTVGADGEWKVTLPMTLQANIYTLSVVSKDLAGKTVSLSRTFTTTKSGEAVVLGDATGSATLAPPTPTPTQVLAQVSITVAPTSTPVPPVVTTTPPVTGDNMMFIMLGSLALVIVAAGVILIF